ncbi:MAG TPA: hypothetical protein IGS40_21940 [Trichormus sp. M33_DOE_039]|nr:hypothetical protein [Trichormus sp. M33_DOE_039]
MGETTAVPSSRRSRRHLLQVGKAAQRSVSPTDCLPKTALTHQSPIPNIYSKICKPTQEESSHWRRIFVECVKYVRKD